MRHLLRLFLAGMVGLAAGGEVDAAALSVSPTRVTFAAGTTSGALTLANTGDSDTVVQVETFAWEDVTAVDQLQPTRDILAVPAVFELPAGGRQIIRVALRAERDPEREQAYRLLITEVPTEDADSGAGVRFALRMSLPVFVTPQGAAPDPQWRLEGDGNGARLRLANAGNAHIHVRSLEIVAGGGDRLLASFTRPVYVLAGQSHVWALDSDLPDGAARVTVKAVTNIGELSFDLPA